LAREEKGSRTCVRPEHDQRPESASTAGVTEFDGQQPTTAIELGKWQTAKIGLEANIALPPLVAVVVLEA
jgi:hypothetical protein